MNKWKLSIVLLLIASTNYALELSPPKAPMKMKDLAIHSWNPVNSLSTHFGKGREAKNDPIINFDLNLSFFRYFMKSDVNENSSYLFNPRFTYIIEFQPFDFASFVNSGSNYSSFVETHDWLRNFTLIVSNRTFSSTQFLTSDRLAYFDLLYNAVDITQVIENPVHAAKSALDNLYPRTMKESFGFSDRFHLYQTSDTALGLVTYFECNIPEDYRKVVKTSYAGEEKTSGIDNAYSSDFTFATLIGLYFRQKSDSEEYKAHIIYQRIQGDYDDWMIKSKLNTGAIFFSVLFDNQFELHSQYYLLQWNKEEFTGTFYSHTVNLGGEIKGFGDGFDWLGFGLNLYFQRMDEWEDVEVEPSGIVGGYNTFHDDRVQLSAYGAAFELNFFPLALHEKNHLLKVSFIGGFFKYNWNKRKYTTTGTLITKSDSGLNYTLMMRAKIDYQF